MKEVPIGVADYKDLIINDYYSVDKSLLIRDILQKKAKVTLITRPRRFGKTINMSMLYYFFDITQDTKELFKDKLIAGSEYFNEINKYPTIFISFADAAGDKEDLIENIKDAIFRQYTKYSYVFKGLDKYEEKKYIRILDALSENFDSLRHIPLSLEYLMEKLENYYHQKVIVLIDEYDQPLIEAHINGYYKDVHKQLALLLSKTLKDNIHLKQAVLTGIQRVVKESIFSKLNNPAVCTVVDDMYSSYFGFTESETKTMLEYYGLSLDELVLGMYDGYKIGGHDIYNPWSIINYINTKQLVPYWLNTSANKMIMDSMEKLCLNEDDKEEFYSEFDKLITEGTLTTTSIDLTTSFYEAPSINSLFGLIVNAGYLTIEETQFIDYEMYYTVRIPNKEVKQEFKKLVARRYQTNEQRINKMCKALVNKDIEEFINIYTDILYRNISSRDLINENSYHLVLLSFLIIGLETKYNITSNREEGKGIYDIQLVSKYIENPHILIELKHTKEDSDDLKVLAQEAINQIIEKKYDYELTGEVLYIGIAHRHKDIEYEYSMKVNAS